MSELVVIAYDREADASAARDSEPGMSALILITRHWNPDAVVAAAAQHPGEVHHTTLPEGVVTSLERALRRPG